MGRKDRFTSRATARLDLSEGDWIEVKTRLSFGEEGDLSNAYIGKMTNLDNAVDAGLGLDFARGQVERLAIWLTDWSFHDENDKPVKLTRDAIKNLDPDTVAEIDAALDAHVEAMEAAKKGTGGTPRLVAKSA